MKQIPPSIYKFLNLACLKSSAPVAEETNCFQTLNITMADTAKQLSQVRLTRSLLPGELLRSDQRTKPYEREEKKAAFGCLTLCVYVCVNAHMCMVVSVHVCVYDSVHMCMVMSVHVCTHGHSLECACMCINICMVVNARVCSCAWS